MGSTSDYTNYLFNTQTPLIGAVLTGNTFTGTPNNLSWTGTTLSTGQAVNWNINGVTLPATYTGYTTADGDPIIKITASGTYQVLTNSTAVSFTAVAAPNFVCFVSGTRILTTRGEVLVEDLAVGDLVVLADGGHKPIRWLGHSIVDCTRLLDPTAAWPVRIAAGALGPNRPSRDLLISPGHALCLDLMGEVLVPAWALVNGATIAQLEMDSVTYWHVELEGGQDIILAEGQPTESYIDTGNRAFFDHGVGTPDLVSTPATRAGYCRPLHDEGPLVEVAHMQLRSRLIAMGWKLDDDAMAGLHLLADGVRIDPVLGDPALGDRLARFLVPADVQDVWLVSESRVPRHVMHSTDKRQLGVFLSGLTVDDGLRVRREIALDDPSLSTGFYEVERPTEGPGGLRRWTSGRARLPAALFADCRNDFFLRVELDALASISRWVRPAAAESRPLEEANPSLAAPRVAHLSLVAEAA